MGKEISDLEKDRRRLESLLKVAQAEAETLRSMPARLEPQARQECDRGQIACKIDGIAGRQSIVLTLDLGVRAVSVCQQEEKHVCTALPSSAKTSDGG